jgi:hypothetical protein
MAQAMEAERSSTLQRVMEERWLNILRALHFFQLTQCYDPGYDNFDQAPFHTTTLAVAGGLVPFTEIDFIEIDFIEID